MQSRNRAAMCTNALSRNGRDGREVFGDPAFMGIQPALGGILSLTLSTGTTSKISKSFGFEKEQDTQATINTLSN